jgi:hypothetical protein
MKRIRLAGQLAEPISHYTDGVEAGGFLYIFGMLPMDAAGELVGVGDVLGSRNRCSTTWAPYSLPRAPPSTMSCGSACMSGTWPTASS